MAEHSRAFFYKAYKLISKLLGSGPVLYGKPFKRAKMSGLCAECDGASRFLWAGDRVLSLEKRELKKPDRQRVVVEKILKALEKDDIWLDVHGGPDSHMIKKSTSFEALMIKADLEQDAVPETA